MVPLPHRQNYFYVVCYVCHHTHTHTHTHAHTRTHTHAHTRTHTHARTRTHTHAHAHTHTHTHTQITHLLFSKKLFGSFKICTTFSKGVLPSQPNCEHRIIPLDLTQLPSHFIISNGITNTQMYVWGGTTQGDKHTKLLQFTDCFV